MELLNRCLLSLSFVVLSVACGSAPSETEGDESPLVDALVETVVDAEVDAIVADEMLVDQMIDEESADAGVVEIPLDCDENPEAEGCEPICAAVEYCARSECEDSEFCRPCLEGGNCAFSGEITFLGTVRSQLGSVVSDILITVACGEVLNEYRPDSEGGFSFSLDVTSCVDLLLKVERVGTSQGYVPVFYRYTMPPPVNTIELAVRLTEAEDIQCDGIVCQSRGFASDYVDDGSFSSGFVYNSRQVNEMNDQFGAIFQSESDELLWLHRYTYREYRNEASGLVRTLPEGKRIVGCVRLDDATRGWVTDLSSDNLCYEYHRREHSIFASEDDEEQWLLYADDLTDPAIDPNNDGFYGAIEMATYQLNYATGKWVQLTDDGGNPMQSVVKAAIERGYDLDENVSFASRVGGDLLVPVPENYLRSVQTTGTYGPSNNRDEFEEDGQPYRNGLYGQDYLCMPHNGSGIFAVGHPMPRTCWLIEVKDECGVPVPGADVRLKGVSHGYVANDLSDTNGFACIEVARSESDGADFDGDGLSNEGFDVDVSIGTPPGVQLSRPETRRSVTPTNDANCGQPENCQVLQFQFQRCLE